jgi:5-(carboxyamino)imidazole ribonucleotide mutase
MVEGAQCSGCLLPLPARGGRTQPRKKLDPIMSTEPASPKVAIIMGSKSDWGVMEHSARQLEKLGVGWEARALSAHRAPDALFEYLSGAPERGIEVVIAAAGMAAHLPGVCAAKTTLPVLGVPMESPSLKGLDSLLSIVQMPGGVPVGTLAIGKAGAVNAALLAVAILGVKYDDCKEAYQKFRSEQTKRVSGDSVLELS